MEHRWHPRHLPCKHRARRGLVRTGTRNQGSLPLIPVQILPTRSENIKFILSGKVRAPSGRARWFPGCWERNSSAGRGGGRGVGLRMPVFRHNDRLSDILILGNLKGLANAFNSESAVVCYPALVPGTFRPRKRFRVSPASGIPGTGHDEQCTRQMALS